MMLKIHDRFSGRVELPTVDVTPESAPAPTTTTTKPRTRKPAKAKTAPSPAPAPVPTSAPLVSHARPWAQFGVAFTLILSAGLNGYANAQAAPLAFAGWLMGLAVPILVLTLSKVAGEKHRAGQKPLAWLAAGSGVALLFLSVWHCANSIALLTGSGAAPGGADGGCRGRRPGRL
jgi:hypothetical protein